MLPKSNEVENRWSKHVACSACLSVLLMLILLLMMTEQSACSIRGSGYVGGSGYHPRHNSDWED